MLFLPFIVSRKNDINLLVPKTVTPNHQSGRSLLMPMITSGMKMNSIYLIPIKIRTHLIFAHLARGKIKGSKFAQYESAKIKGTRKNATMSKKIANSQ